MIKISFLFNDCSDTLNLTVTGHGLADINNKPATKGNDILCAGVSSLVQSILIGLNFVVKAHVDIKEKRNGYLECEIQSVSQHDINILIKTLFISLKEIEKDYPEKIQIEEVRRNYGS